MTAINGSAAGITGAASGQGAAEARLFAAEGAAVVVADVDEPGGRAVATGLGDSAVFVPLDVADASQWTAAVEQAVAAFGGVDVLVNNAGIGFPPRRIEDERPEEHDRVLATNLRGVYLGMRAVVPVLAARGGGSIVNISSIDGLVGVIERAGACDDGGEAGGVGKVVAPERGGF